MICSSVKQSLVPISDSKLFTENKFLIPKNGFSLSPHNPIVSIKKPLHVSSFRSFGNFEVLKHGVNSKNSSSSISKKCLLLCKARDEAEDQSPAPVVEGSSVAAAKKLKIGIYFATWWALNVVFNIYNKKVLNAFPYPWLTSTLSLATGSLMMLISWATKIAEPPKTDFEFWKTLSPVAVAHTIGHVAATVSMSKVAVSFTHIIKSGEPAFSVLVSRFLLGETFPSSVYLSLIPIIGGCGLAALSELNFNMMVLKYFKEAGHADDASMVKPSKTHRDEYIRCSDCTFERRFHLRTKEESRLYHDEVAKNKWSCSHIGLKCGEESERNARKNLRGCPRAAKCEGCTTCVCFGCHICQFSDCSCRTCLDFYNSH